MGKQAPVSKIDLKKKLKHLYSAGKECDIVEVPQMDYLMVDGKGAPGNRDFHEAVEALYTVSYTLKFMAKNSRPKRDYSVMPLEGLWWTAGTNGFNVKDKDSWNWTMMIMQPSFITAEMVIRAMEEAGKKKELPALHLIRYESLNEGASVQIMHIGPYEAVGTTVGKMMEFLHEKGMGMRGKHHEIWLNDPRRTKPEKLKTIVRQPVERRLSPSS